MLAAQFSGKWSASSRNADGREVQVQLVVQMSRGTGHVGVGGKGLLTVSHRLG